MAIVVHDLRSFLRKNPGWRGAGFVYDARLLCGGKSIDDIVREQLPDRYGQYLDDRDQIKAIRRSAQIARVDGSVPVERLVPSGVIQRFKDVRSKASQRVYEDALQNEPERLRAYEKETYPFALALIEIENNGVWIDRTRAHRLLREGGQSQPTERCLRSMLGSADGDGFVWTEYCPVGGRTGRVMLERGFETMSIPHGPARDCVRSRFKEAGEIWTLDYNAIDYRSIVSSVGDREFASLYYDCSDFHDRTREILGAPVQELDRTTLKKLTYVHLYGGSTETLVRETGFSHEKVAAILDVFQKKMGALTHFREKLFAEVQHLGHVTLPNGRRVSFGAGAHPGQVLGLYAQSFSSYVFERALVKVVEHLSISLNNGCLPVFPVHDELVFDVAKGFPMESLVEIMETAVTGYRFKVKTKRGESYAQATDG